MDRRWTAHSGTYAPPMRPEPTEDHPDMLSELTSRKVGNYVSGYNFYRWRHTDP